MTKVSRALFGSLFTSFAVPLTVDGAESGVIDTLGSRPRTLLILC